MVTKMCKGDPRETQERCLAHSLGILEGYLVGREGELLTMSL